MPEAPKRSMLVRIAWRLCGSTSRGRLVEHEQGRAVQQRGADVEAPAHAARERLHAVVGPFRELDQGEHLVDAFLQQAAAQAVEPPKELQVLARAQVGIQRKVLRHVADVRTHPNVVSTDLVRTHRDPSRVGVQETTDHPDRGRLARAVRTQQSVGFPGRDSRSPRRRRCDHRTGA